MNIPPMQPRDTRPAGDRCEVTLRDTFAAAALTGLVCNGDFSMESIPSHAFSMADSMLRERERSKPPEPCVWKDGIPVAWWNKTNHDAVPEARARTDADSDRTDKAVLRPGEGTGNTWSQLWNPKDSEILPRAVIGIAWVEFTRSHIIKMGDGKTAWIDLPLLSPLPKDATPMAGSGQFVPAKDRTPDYSEDGRVRASALSIGNTQKPVAWAVTSARDGVLIGFCHTHREANRLALAITQSTPQHCALRVAPLYRHQQPILTAEERAAVEWYANFPDGIHAATLRKLLERMK